MSPDHQVICAHNLALNTIIHPCVMTTSLFALSYHSSMVERERICTKASLCKISSQRQISFSREQVPGGRLAPGRSCKYQFSSRRPKNPTPVRAQPGTGRPPFEILFTLCVLWFWSMRPACQCDHNSVSLYCPRIIVETDFLCFGGRSYVRHRRCMDLSYILSVVQNLKVSPPISERFPMVTVTLLSKSSNCHL